MPELKLTKNELRQQQIRLSQLERYLPTLQLKKALLQAEVQEARTEIVKYQELFAKRKQTVDQYSPLLSQKAVFDPEKATKVQSIKKQYENIAGVEVPYFQGVDFEPFAYSLFATPAWMDPAIFGLRAIVEAQTQVEVAHEKKRDLEKELRQVSIRVNLFEKILIPRARENIKRIKVYLGDVQLAEVARAKVAKAKIEAAKHAG
jgi:V/A-type H+-transporting ATPase subunit D